MEARRPHVELHDILCEFVNDNEDAIRELKGGDEIPEKLNLSKPISQIVKLFYAEYLMGLGLTEEEVEFVDCRPIKGIG